MEWALAMDLIADAIRLVLVVFLGYGAYLVLGAGGFHRDAPEDAAEPHLDLAHKA